MKKKKILTILLLSFVIIVILFVSFLIYVKITHTSSRLEKETQVDLIDQGSEVRLFIPIEIEGNIYNFLFDTGAQLSIIEPELVNKLGYDSLTFQRQTSIVGVTEDADGHILVVPVPIKIGSLKITCDMMTYRSNEKSDITSFFHRVRIPNISGLIAQDIISKYNWLFDFRGKKVTIKNGEIEIPLHDDDEMLQWNFRLDRVPYVDLSFENDTLSFPFAFDTGLSLESEQTNVMDTLGKHIRFPIDFVAEETLFRVLNNKKDFFLDTYADSMVINGEKLYAVSMISRDNDSIKIKNNFISINFPLRYRMMYYNSKKKQINFYSSSKDPIQTNAQNQRKETNDFIQILKRLEKEGVLITH